MQAAEEPDLVKMLPYEDIGLDDTLIVVKLGTSLPWRPRDNTH